MNRTHLLIPRAVWALGFVSLLMDVSSELIHSLLPVFMFTTLGMSAFAIGLIEGAAEATALIVKVFSGAISDWWGKRKPLAVLGYGLGAFSKPLFAIAGGAGLVVTARPSSTFPDRFSSSCWKKAKSRSARSAPTAASATRT